MGIGLIVAVVGGELLLFGARTAPEPALPEMRPAATHPMSAALPAFSLTSHSGKPFTDADLRGRWTFLFFGYTHCPDVCPTSLTAMAEVARLLANDRSFLQPQVVFISLDGQRDSPSLLADYVPAFNPGFIGVTGTDAQLAPLVKSLGVFYERHGATNGNYLIDHTAGVFLIDPSARLSAAFAHPPRAELIAERYRLLAGGNQNLK